MERHMFLRYVQHLRGWRKELSGIARCTKCLGRAEHAHSRQEPKLESKPSCVASHPRGGTWDLGPWSSHKLYVVPHITLWATFFRQSLEEGSHCYPGIIILSTPDRSLNPHLDSKGPRWLQLACQPCSWAVCFTEASWCQQSMQVVGTIAACSSEQMRCSPESDIGRLSWELIPLVWLKKMGIYSKVLFD